MKRLSKKLLYTLGVTLICGGMQLHAQSLDQAKKLYNDGKYAEAKPVFEKLVKQAPSNASYNQWYGVCCFETGDLAGAEKHLKVAVGYKTLIDTLEKYTTRPIVLTKPRRCSTNTSPS